MSLLEEAQRPLDNKAIPPFIVGAVATAAVLSLYFLVPGLQPLELLLMLLVVGFAAIGSGQDSIRGMMTAAIVYIASGVAAAFYRMIAPYVSLIWQSLEIVIIHSSSGPLSRTVGRDALASSFVLLTVITGVALEALGRISVQDTSLPALGVLDSLGGILTYLVTGILVATLVFNAIGYGRAGEHAHNAALLRPTFNRVLYLHYTAQSFWFPRRPPPIYVYDLDQLRGL